MPDWWASLRAVGRRSLTLFLDVFLARLRPFVTKFPAAPHLAINRCVTLQPATVRHHVTGGSQEHPVGSRILRIFSGSPEDVAGDRDGM